MQHLANWSTRARLHVLPQFDGRFGSTHRNFLRLIREAPLEEAEYVALADQDDVWLPAKLARAVHCLGTLPADAYSSDVTAFWPDGRRQLIRKSQPQRSYDYLFGSAGPGCTFVMPRAVFDGMRDWVIAKIEQIKGIWVHDWLIYGYVRGHGLRWHIDDEPNMLPPAWPQRDWRQRGLARGAQSFSTGSLWRLSAASLAVIAEAVSESSTTS